MNNEKDSVEQIEQDAQKSMSRIDQGLGQPSPAFLNEGPEMVRDSNC